MYIFAFISFAAFLTALYLGCYVYHKDRKNSLNRVFGLFCITVAMYSFSKYNYRLADTHMQALAWCKLGAIWPFSIAFLLHMVLLYTGYWSKLPRRSRYALLYAPAAVITLVEFTTDFMTKGMVKTHWGWTYEYADSVFAVVVIVWAACMALTTLSVSANYYAMQTSASKKDQARLITVALFIITICSIPLDFMFPFVASGVPGLTTTGFLVGSLFIGRAIWKYRLFTIIEKPDKLFECIYADSHIGIGIYDHNGSLLQANRASMEMFGVSDLSEVKKFNLFGDPHFSVEFLEDLQNGKTRQIEISYNFNKVRAQNLYATTMEGIRTYLVQITPMRIENSSFNNGYLVQYHDFTDRRRIEKELQIKNFVIESSIVPTIISDLRGKLIYANPSFLQAWGYHRNEEVIGMPITNFWNIEDKAPEIMDILHNRGSWIGEQVASRKDSGTFPVQAIASLVLDETATIIGMTTSFIEITERKKTEERLVRSEERYRGIVENIPFLICCFLPESGVITYVNETYCRYFDRSREELVGRSFLLLVPMEEHERVRSHFSSLTPERPSITYEHLVNTPLGQRRHRWTDQAIFDQHGSIIEYQSIGEDLSGHKTGS